MTIRPARAHDLPAMTRLLNESSAAFYRDILEPDEYLEPWYNAPALARDLEPYQVLVAESASGLLGLIAFGLEGYSDIYVFLLFLAPAQTRRGLGTTLFAEVVEAARHAGRRRLLVQVHRRAVWATTAYFRWGFRVAAEGEGSIRGWEDGLLAGKESDANSLLLVCPVEAAGAGLAHEEASRLAARYAGSVPAMS